LNSRLQDRCLIGFSPKAKPTADQRDEFNAIYAEVMGDAKPAKAIVAVPEHHFGVLIEIETVAMSALLRHPRRYRCRTGSSV
jgi:hypothetical protein